MNSDNITKRTRVIVKSAAACIGILGACIIGYTVVSLFINFSQYAGWTDIFFLLAFVLPVIAFGCYCIYIAYKTWHDISAKNLRRIVFVITFLIALLICSLFAHPLKKIKVGEFVVSIIIIIAGIIQMAYTKLIAKRLHLEPVIDWAKRERSVKRYFGLLAFFLFTDSLRILMEIAPKEPFEIILFWGSLAAAILIYQVCVRVALRNKPKEKPPAMIETSL
ncbi:MAG: hypothetical protein A2Y07_06620 [Planctomycetes bacterium GWF2_50_10]|nr:MAG: hypothetical protein A2Y07_06620 [Planctomycetes bacterium GWF2_50_10]